VGPPATIQQKALATMFNDLYLHPIHTFPQPRPSLRPELMKAEYVEHLRRRDAERRAGLWQSAWRGIMQLTEHLAFRVGNALLGWVEQRKLQLPRAHREA
jgi:hypothetical protein